MSHTRRLVAIMFTDMVGFTALMQQDETLGLKKRKRHKEVFEKFHVKYNGEIVQYFGDGTLSIFSNSCDAVECAIDIQKSLKAPIEVPLRVGIHTGHAIIEEDGIIGDAINIASRIESFANPHGVFISDTVHDQVKNQTQLDFVSLGKFNLKNIDRPFEIYAVDSEGLEVPSADYLHGKGELIAPLKTDIPELTSPIIGRDKELKDLIKLIDQNRVVTITGTGGVGKTRISLEICKILKPNFQDGIAHVSMATITEPEQVIPTLANALDIKEGHDRELIDGIAALVSDKKGMIVLDNLEHVISAAKEIASLISLCPNLKFLCTSRTPLKIQSEAEYPLSPLLIPETGIYKEIKRYPSVELFVKRATQTNSDFELTKENAQSVVEICRRVDGLPLAIELAAARCRILSPEKLLDRLSRSLDILTTGSRDMPDRHQTLRTTIEWSYSLLNDSEKKLFRRLSVFESGFTIEAVESVCYDEEDSYLAIDELESLIDKGLVVSKMTGARFSLLQTINDYGLEKLNEFNEVKALKQKHAEYYAEFTFRLGEGTAGNNQSYWMRQGPLEEANIMASLDFLVEEAANGDQEACDKGFEICGNLWMFWHIRGKHKTAKRVLLNLLDSSDDLPSLAKLKGLFTLNISFNLLGEFETGKKYAIIANEMAESINDDVEIAKAYFASAFAFMPFDMEKALAFSDDCIEGFTKMNTEYFKAFALWQRGVLSMVSGRPQEAKQFYSDAKPLFLKLGDNEGKGCVLSGLALIQMIEGDFDGGIDLYQEALIAFKAVGDRPEEARLYSELAWHFLLRRNTHLGKKYALESIQAHHEVGSMRGVGSTMFCFSALQSIEGNAIDSVMIAAAAESFAQQEGVVVENGFGFNNQGKVFLEEAKGQLSDSEIENAEISGKQLSLNQLLQMVEDEVVILD